MICSTQSRDKEWRSIPGKRCGLSAVARVSPQVALWPWRCGRGDGVLLWRSGDTVLVRRARVRWARAREGVRWSERVGEVV